MKAWLLEKRWRVILAGILIVAIPLLGLALYVYLEVIDIIKGNARTNVLMYSSHAVHKIKAQLASHIAYGKAYATRPYLIDGLKRGNKKELDTHLEELVENSHSIQRVFITDAKGVEIAAYPEDPLVIGLDFSYRDWYKGVSRDWQPYVSEFYMRKAWPQRYLFAIAIPVKINNGKVIGIIVMQPEDDYIRDALSEVFLEKGILYVVDRNGNLIYHPDYTIDRIIDFSQSPAVQKVRKGLSGVERLTDPATGERILAAYHPVEKWGWGVIAEMPEGVVLANVRKITLTLVAFTGFMLLIGGVFAYMAAVQTSEIARSRLYTEKMLDPLWVLDSENRTVDINPAFTRLFGYSHEEMLGRSVFEFLNEKNREIILREFERRWKGESSTYEVEVRAKDGTDIPVLLSGSPLIERGRMMGKIGVMKDIREHKRLEVQVNMRTVELEEINRRLEAEEQAEKAYNEFLTILNRQWPVPEGLGDAFLRKINELTCMEAGVLYLHKQDELTPLSTLAVKKPSILEGLPYEALRQKRTLRIVDIPQDTYMRIETGPGTLIPREIIVIPLLYLDEPVGILELACIHGFKERCIMILERIAPQLATGINTIQNLLKLKRLSDELSQSNEELQSLNEELQAQRQELAEANIRLEAASRAKSDFLANMSHELRTPLNSIIGFSEILQDRLYGELNEKQHEYIEDILSSGRHLLSLINDILDLAKVESGKIELELSSFPLKEVLNTSMVMFKEKAMKHEISLNLDMAPEADIEIEADMRKLKQVMFNLLSNAVKFTPDGGSISVRTRRVRSSELGVRRRGEESSEYTVHREEEKVA